MDCVGASAHFTKACVMNDKIQLHQEFHTSSQHFSFHVYSHDFDDSSGQLLSVIVLGRHCLCSLVSNPAIVLHIEWVKEKSRRSTLEDLKRRLNFVYYGEE